jgi:hypothetical protein
MSVAEYDQHRRKEVTSVCLSRTPDMIWQLKIPEVIET